MSDELMWGTSRPLFRIGNNRYVMNQPESLNDIDFPKQIILNESVLTGNMWEHKIVNRGIFTITWDKLDRPSSEIMRTIVNNDLDTNDLYMRPHFNFYREYKVRCANGWELDRFGKVNRPYKGALTFETMSTLTDIPDESSGSFSFDGSTKVGNGTLALSGDLSCEMWIKTPSSISATQRIFTVNSGADVIWRFSMLADQKFRFQTDNGITTSDLDTTNAYDLSTWYHIVIRRVSTDEKRIVINSTQDGSEADGYVANGSVDQIYLGASSNAFQGLVQIMRFYSSSIYEKFDNHAMEAIPSGQVNNIEVWWDFSQGNTDDLSGNSKDGTVTGTETYEEESFPDKGYEINT